MKDFEKMKILSKTAAKVASGEAEKHNENATLIECISNNPDNYSFEEVVNICNIAKQYFSFSAEYFDWFEQMLIAKLHCDIRVSVGNYCAETVHKRTYEIIIYCKDHRIVFASNDTSTIYIKTSEYMVGLPFSDLTEVLNRLNEEVEGLNLHIPFYDKTLKNIILSDTTITEEQINSQTMYPY